MDDQLIAYDAGRSDGMAGVRDPSHAAHPHTGADYRIGFLDGRIEMFHLLAAFRRIQDEFGDDSLR